MRHSKLILIACISTIIPLATAILGYQGTIIGSVFSSVLYNVLSSILSDAVDDKSGQSTNNSTNVWSDVAYVIPLIVMFVIQILLILAFLSEWGILPDLFLDAYLSVQDLALGNLYRLLGISSIVMSLYPFILRRKVVKKYHGLVVLLVGFLFLLKGFSDIGGVFSLFYDQVLHYFNFPIAIVTLVLLGYVIYAVLYSIMNADDNVEPPKRNFNRNRYDSEHEHIASRTKKYFKPRNNVRSSNRRKSHYREPVQPRKSHYREPVQPRKSHYREPVQPKINESIDDIRFESNDLLDDYKK